MKMIGTSVGHKTINNFRKENKIEYIYRIFTSGTRVLNGMCI